MMQKRIAFACFSIAAFAVIGWIFWQQELKYAIPTPRPALFKDVSLGTTIDIDLPGVIAKKGTVLHFFNPECPCSRFDMSHFESMAKRYAGEIAFAVILQAEDEDAVQEFQDKYSLNIPVILDKQGEISDRCGIYSTPQAVMLDENNTLYFKGNYNKSRFCTRKETSYAEIALDSLILGKPLPVFVQNELTLPYGCTLPSDETSKSSLILKLFN
jgi:hypothetical protein